MKKKCVSCRAKIDSDSKFCSVCGAKQEKNEPIMQQNSADKSTTAITSIPDSKRVVYFKNGFYSTMKPPPPPNLYENRDLIYNADFLVSDGVKYDLSDISDIRSIKVPDFRSDNSGSPVYSLDYALRMRASTCSNNEQHELCSAFLWKSTELMLANTDMNWRRKDFNRLIYWHNEMGMFDEAEKAKAYLNQFELYTANRFDLLAKQFRDTAFRNAKSFNSDLVVFHDQAMGCCDTCSKYIGRVYSISGRSIKFPRLPEYAKEHGNFHPGCRCVMQAYLGGEIYLHGKSCNALIASARPYRDTRKKEEIEAYDRALKAMVAERAEEERRLEYSRLKGINRIEYFAIKKALPDLAPKTLTGYIRMKNSNSKNFIKLQERAKAIGITITEI